MYRYSKRLAEVAEKQRYGAPETTDQSTDQHQERINFEQLRITEVSDIIYDLIRIFSVKGGGNSFYLDIQCSPLCSNPRDGPNLFQL